MLYVYLIGVIVAAAMTGGAYFKGRGDGADLQLAAQAKEQQLVEKVKQEAMQGAADAISKIEIKQVTIQGRLQKEIQTNVVYRDCAHTPDGLRSLNDALTNTDGPRPVSGSVLPPASAPAGWQLWFDRK